jgi:DNA-binding NarL/FixJ family response regulator
MTTDDRDRVWGRPASIRVVIADDEGLIRTGIGRILASAGDIEVVAEAADGRAAVEAVRRHRVDVVLLDIRMPVLDGLAALEEIQRLTTDTRVVMLTTFGADDYISRALRSGASGFILKDSTPTELISAVRSVADGHAYLSPKVTRRVVDHLSGGTGVLDPGAATRAATRAATLTDRERDVLVLLADGLPNHAIAKRLFMTEASIRTYVSRILAKLDCVNRVQAALLAHHAGLLRPDDTGR